MTKVNDAIAFLKDKEYILKKDLVYFVDNFVNDTNAFIFANEILKVLQRNILPNNKGCKCKKVM